MGIWGFRRIVLMKRRKRNQVGCFRMSETWLGASEVCSSGMLELKENNINNETNSGHLR
jgi:hypothetical protein